MKAEFAENRNGQSYHEVKQQVQAAAGKSQLQQRVQFFFFLASNKLLITLTKYSKKSLRRLQTPSPAGVTVAGEGSVPPAGYRAGASCSNRRLLLKLFRAVPSTGASRRRTEPCFSCVLFPFLINLGVLIDETTADEC